MNNSVIAILIGIVLIAVTSVIILKDSGPPRMDFQEIISDNAETGEITESPDATTTGAQAIENGGEVESEEPEKEEPLENEEDTNTNDEQASQDEEVPGAEEDVVVESAEATTTEEESITEQATSTTEEIAPEESTTTEEISETIEEVTEEQSSVPPNYVAYLKFDDTSGSIAKDETGNSNFGTLLNTDTEIAWNSGQFDGAVFLDGINDYIAISHSESLNLGTKGQSYTLSFWFRAADEPDGERQIIGKGGRSGPSPFMIRINKEGEPSFRISDGFSATTINIENSIANGSWKHITAVRDAETSRLRMYVDGFEQGGLIFDTTTKSLQNTNHVYINRHEIGTDAYRYHNFAIDDLRIINRALSPEEVKEVFNEGK